MIWKRAARLGTKLVSRGLVWSFGFLLHRYLGGLVLTVTRRRCRQAIRQLLLQIPAGTKIVVVKSTLDYRFPYDQRPHHIARAIAKSGDLVFFVSRGSGYDQIGTVRKLADNLFVTRHMELLSDLCPSAALIVFSTDTTIGESLLASWHGAIVYDYIDAIDDCVSSAPVTREYLELHHRLLVAQDKVFCLASATRLFEDIAAYRSKNFALIENAVDTAHFQVARSKAALDSRHRAIIEQGKPIAGYFGALAQWLDYDLLTHAARALPDINFVAIGIDYDGSVAALDDAPANLHVLPPISYSALPKFAVWFDVALLPFKINHITVATSPLKLFEYMALGLPIVSTAIPEAKKYDNIAVVDTADRFTASILAALTESGSASRRQSILDRARENDWMARAAAIRHLIEAQNQPAVIGPKTLVSAARPASACDPRVVFN